MFIFFCGSITLCAVQYCTVYVNFNLFTNYEGRNVAFLTDSMRQVSLHRGGGQRTGGEKSESEETGQRTRGDRTVNRKRQESEPQEIATVHEPEGDRTVKLRTQNSASEETG
jgi:hypothetical protein